MGTLIDTIYISIHLADMASFPLGQFSLFFALFSAERKCTCGCAVCTQAD